MTFEELNKKIGGSEQPDDWRQSKAGGWIHKTAKIEREENIQDNAIVWGTVYGSARVYGDAWVYGSARVYGDAWVYGSARVYGDAWEKSPLFILGSRFSLTNCKRGHIQIGCECHPFAWWKKNGKELAAKQSFTKEEISEYEAYLSLFIKIGK